MCIDLEISAVDATAAGASSLASHRVEGYCCLLGRETPSYIAYHTGCSGRHG